MTSSTVGVVVAHGELARAMVGAVRKIAGADADALTPVSNDGLGPDELQEAILRVIDRGPAVVFTDLGAGSCTLAARVSCRNRAQVAVVTGVNLPMLLDFVFHREMPLEELLPRLEEKAHSGIRVLPGA